MGFFFSNLHVRKNSSFSLASFSALLSELLNQQGYKSSVNAEEADLSVSVYDGGKWLSVCSDGLEFGENTLCDFLSRKLAADVLTVSCYDSDCLLLNCVNTENKLCAWAKVGSYPGLRQRTTLARWAGIVEDLPQWKDALNVEYVFAEDAMDELEPMLGLDKWQGRFCPELIEENFSGRTQTFYYALPESAAKPEPPRLKIDLYELTPHKMGTMRCVSALNIGGKSSGIAIAFSGSYVEREEISFTDVQFEYGFNKSPLKVIPLTLEKRRASDGQWIYYAEIPQFQIPSRAKDGLPPRKEADEKFARSFLLRFTPVGDNRKQLDITVHFIPLKNPSGQCSWYVWKGYRSKRDFIEAFNKIQLEDAEDFKIMGIEPELFKPEDFDLDD